MWPEIGWVSLGGFVGANARYLVGDWISARVAGPYPWSTFAINVSGSLAIGVLLTLLVERLALAPAWRLLLVTGFLGAYTTFSSFMLDSVSLLLAGHFGIALLYLLGSNVAGLLAVAIGIGLARRLDV